MPARSSRMNAVVASAGSSRSARGQRAGRGRGLLHRRPRHRHEHVHALGTARLHRSRQAGVGQRLPDETSGADGQAERVPVRRVDVEHQMRGLVPMPDAHQRQVVFHGALIGEPQQRTAVVAQRVRHLAPGRLRPQPYPRHPRRGVFRQVLLHERGLAAQHPHDRQRPIRQVRHEPLPDGVQVVDQVALGRLRPLEQRLVEVGERNPVADLTAAHADHLPDGRYLARRCSCIASARRRPLRRGRGGGADSPARPGGRCGSGPDRSRRGAAFLPMSWAPPRKLGRGS